MTDRLLSLGASPFARSIARQAGFSLPQRLRRNTQAFPAAPLAGTTAQVVHIGQDPLGIGARLVAAGATLKPDTASEVIVVDATSLQSMDEVPQLFADTQAAVRMIAPHGRVVILGTDTECTTTPHQAAIAQGLDGFTRSLAKELGKKAATCNRIAMPPHASQKGSKNDIAAALQAVAGPLTFLASDYAAFITGQTLVLDAGALESARRKQNASRPLHQALTNKIALVTGAARGIGAATAKRLAAEGATVLCVDVPQAQSDLDRVASDIAGQAIALDITGPLAPDDLARVIDAHQGIDIVVHNAGITRDKTLAGMKPTHWQSVLDVNLNAIMRLNERVLLPGLRDSGRMILLSSIGGIGGNAGQTNYAYTKAALVALARHSTPDFATKEATINAIAPGFIETDMTARMPFAIREAARRLATLNQGGLPIDIANAIAFLATPAAFAIRGQTLRVCGGNLMGA